LAKGFNPQPEPPARCVVNADGGAGDDRIDVMSWVGFNPQPEPPARSLGDSFFDVFFDITADGGAGNDVIDAAFDLDELIGQLAVAVNGGRGNDIIRIDAHGQVSSDAVFRISGGKGNDHIRSNFDVAVIGDPELRVEALGGRGRDNLGLAIRGVDDRDRLFALLDGGRGFDVGFATSNVTVRNIERLWRLR